MRYRLLLQAFLFVSLFVAKSAMAEEIDVWIGTSNNKASQGIYHCLLDTEAGKLSPSKLVAEIRGPGFLAMHPSRPVLYAVGTLEGTPSVVAYSIEGTGKKAGLKLINALPIGDGGAAHVSVDPTGRLLLTAQYGGGSTGAFKLNEDGSLHSQTMLRDHTAAPAKVVGNRQDAPHAHWTGFSPDNRFAFVPDLGLDKVVIYKTNFETTALEHHGYGDVPPGGGPRHMKFHPETSDIYVLNELELTISVFDYDAETGSMTRKQDIPTVSKEEKDQEIFKSCSEIRVHPNGKFVYAANRGHDTITVFRIGNKGLLEEVQNEHVRGATPRNFNITPDGKWLLAAGQDSHTLACFAVNDSTGRITYNRSIISTPAPICVLFQYEK